MHRSVLHHRHVDRATRQPRLYTGADSNRPKVKLTTALIKLVAAVQNDNRCSGHNTPDHADRRSAAYPALVAARRTTDPFLR